MEMRRDGDMSSWRCVVVMEIRRRDGDPSSWRYVVMEMCRHGDAS